MKNLTGMVFNNWEVLELARIDKFKVKTPQEYREVFWKCCCMKCDKEALVRARDLLYKNRTSFYRVDTQNLLLMTILWTV